MNSKFIIVGLMFLTFLGQELAASAVYCPMKSTMKSQEQSNMMTHSAHQMSKQVLDSSSASSSDMTEDCCTLFNNCTMGGCVLFTVPNLSTSIEIDLSFQNILLPTNLAKSQPISSLFRPPILS